jgi:hypothetical protein
MRGLGKEPQKSLVQPGFIDILWPVKLACFVFLREVPCEVHFPETFNRDRHGCGGCGL